MTSLQAHHRSGGVLQRRNGVNVLGRHALLAQVGEARGQGIHAHATLVEWDADDVHLEAAQSVHCALVGEDLHDDRIARLQQNLVDQVNGGVGPRGD